MKCNENRFLAAILLKLHPIGNAFPVWFQTIIVQTQGLEIMLVQCCFKVLTLKQYWIKVILTPCADRVFIWTLIPVCLWTPGTLSQKGYPCNPFKNLEEVTESCFLKKTVLKFCKYQHK